MPTDWRRIGCEHQEHICRQADAERAGYGADLDGIAGGQHRGIISGKRVLFLHYGERAFPVSAAGEHDSHGAQPDRDASAAADGVRLDCAGAGDADSDGVFGHCQHLVLLQKAAHAHPVRKV